MDVEKVKNGEGHSCQL